MSFNMKLPDERGEQLRQIAAAKGIPMVQVVEDAIRREIAEGTIPADLPGISVTKTATTVRIEMPDFESEVPAIEAARLADSLREAGSDLTADDVERKKRWLEGLAALSGIKLERMAHGVRLISPVTGRKYSLGFGVAADLADQIERNPK